MDTLSPIVSDPVESIRFQMPLPAGKDQTQVTAEEAAKGFESIFILKLLEEMTETVGKWGFEKESGSEQIQGLFSLCLSQHLADNGGLGLYKQIYESVGGILDSQPQLSQENL